MLEALKREVYKANILLLKYNLVKLSFGNVSEIDRKKGLIVIKPSGVPYDKLKPEFMVVVDLEGRVVEGRLKPSSDTPTHIALYKAWKEIGAISHTHSPYATIFAQACVPIPCLGTTHADEFYGEVPVTRCLSRSEVEKDYEKNTAKVIIETFETLNPMEMPGVLVAGHGPFTWAKTATQSVERSLILEEVARMAYGTIRLNPKARPISGYLLKKHFFRKHGKDATYGQKIKK